MNANDTLGNYTCTENWHRHPFGALCTDGVEALCEKFECYWLLDVVMCYQDELNGEEFQVWRLKRYDDPSAIVTCEDGKGNILRQQEIFFTDFEATEATIWVEHGVALLPSEH